MGKKSKQNPIRRLGLVSVFFGLLALALFLLWMPGFFILVRRVFFHFQVQQEEAVNVWFGLLLAKGQALYPDITKGGPYIHCSYPPLFPFLLSLGSKFSSDLWLPGRLLAFGSYLGCGLAMGVWGWKKWRPKGLTLSLVLLLWLSPTWALWGSMVRMDTFLIFLNFTSFLILLKSEKTKVWKEKNGWRYFLGAGFLNSMALLCKPTAATLTLAFALDSCVRQKWKELLIFLSAALVPFFMVEGLAQWETHGLYWEHTVRWAAVGFEGGRFAALFWGSFMREAGWLLALAGLALWAGKARSLLGYQFFFSGISILSLAREGSAENYYMEFMLYALFLAGEGFSTMFFDPTRKKAWVAGSLFAVILLGGVFSLTHLPWPGVPSQTEVEMKKSASAIYQNGEKHLALDNDLPLMAGKGIWYQHSGIVAIARAGVWDPAPLIRDIRAHAFSTIEFYNIPVQTLYPPAVEAAVRENYKVAVREYGRLWLVPKSAESPARGNVGVK